MSLSSLIVQREVASIRQVEEALARQVLYGGDLVTNLMEVVQLPESILVPLIAESTGMTAAPIGLLPPPTPQARSLVPEDVATRRIIMPLAVEAGRLILAVAEPLSKDALQELSFALGVGIEERIAPTVRVHEALARVYGLPLERRMARLVGRLAGVDPTAPNSLPPLRAARASAPPLPGALSHDLPKLNPPGMPLLGTLGLPERAPANEPPRGGSIAAHAVLPRLLRETKQTADVHRRRGPLTFDRFTEELGEIKDREALLHLFFDFCRQFFEYSAIFVVHGDIAEGRDAFGTGAPRDRVLALGVPLDMPSLLRTVRERAVPVCAFPEEGGLDAVLMSDLRRDVRSKVLIVPVVVRSRVVAFFVADDGASGIDPSAQGEVTTVAALVGREFERLIVRTKLQGFAGEVPVQQRRVDPRRVEPKRRRPELRDAAVQVLEQVVASSIAETSTPADAAAPSEKARPTEVAPPPSAMAAPGDPGAALPPSSAGRPTEVAPPPPASARPTEVAAPPSAAVRPTEVVAPPSPVAPVAARPTEVAAPPDDDLPVVRQSPVPRSYRTLRNFPMPQPDAAADVESDATDKAPIVAPVAPAARAPFPAALPVDDPIDDPVDHLEPEPYVLPSDFQPTSVPVLTGELSDRPPPPQAAAVRRPSGQPIPREEVDIYGDPIPSTRFASERISSRPPPADLRQARLLRDIDSLAAQFVHPPPSARVPGPMSARGAQAITVPPHLPPSSRTQESLPSVIVEIPLETDRLVTDFIADPRNEQTEAELLRLGQHAMPSIMKHFPGPITIRRDTLDDTWPRASECGPVLRLIAGQRRVALPFVVTKTDDPDTEIRFWSTYLLTELAYAEAVPAVVARLFDDSKRVRRAARLVAHVLGDVAGAVLVAELDRIVRDTKATSARRVVTLDALGEMRDPLVVPVLLGTLADDDEDVALAARRALMLVSRQDFARDTKRWIAWWQSASSRHRIEWLIDALTHEVPALRRAAGQELKALTEQYFGYYDDLPKKDRERAQQKYRDWWKNEGQARFRRA